MRTFKPSLDYVSTSKQNFFKVSSLGSVENIWWQKKEVIREGGGGHLTLFILILAWEQRHDLSSSEINVSIILKLEQTWTMYNLLFFTESFFLWMLCMIPHCFSWIILLVSLICLYLKIITASQHSSQLSTSTHSILDLLVEQENEKIKNINPSQQKVSYVLCSTQIWDLLLTPQYKSLRLLATIKIWKS